MKNWAKSLLAVIALLCLFAPVQAADMGNTSVFSQTDGSNNSGTVPTWAEGMAPSQVNDSGRALQGAITRWYTQLTCGQASAGTDTITITYSVAPAALYTGQRFCFEAGGANTGAATLNINSLGAKAIKKEVAGTQTDLSANDIRSGQHVEVVYDSSSDVFIMVSELGNATVTGPGSSTDNAIVRWDGTSGSVIQNSGSPIIDDSGRLVLGSTAAISTFNAPQPNVQILGTGGTTASTATARFSADADPGRILFGKSRAASVGTYTVVQNNDDLGSIEFYGADGTNLDIGASIVGESDGTPGTDDMPGRLSLRTTTDAANAATERLRIDSGHNIFAYKDDGSNPGQVIAHHWINLTSDNTLSNSGSAQAIFDGGGGPTNGRLTVDTGTYGIECRIIVTSMSATSGNAALGLAGTATLGNIVQTFTGLDATTLTTAAASGGSATQTATSGTNVVTAGTGTAMFVDWHGQFDVTAAGTIIPQITLTTAAAAVVEQGSRCSFYRLGNTATATVGAWD